METATTNSRAEGTSLNEFRMLKYFKRKWKRFWIISLNTYRRVYTVSALTAGLPFFTCKCDEMHLRWVFTVQTAVILLKNIFEFMFNNTPKYSFLCVTRGLEVRPLPSKVPRSIPGRTFSFRFPLFFSSFFSFSFRLGFILGTIITHRKSFLYLFRISKTFTVLQRTGQTQQDLIIFNK